MKHVAGSAANDRGDHRSRPPPNARRRWHFNSTTTRCPCVCHFRLARLLRPHAAQPRIIPTGHCFCPPQPWRRWAGVVIVGTGDTFGDEPAAAHRLRGPKRAPSPRRPRDDICGLQIAMDNPVSSPKGLRRSDARWATHHYQYAAGPFKAHGSRGPTTRWAQGCPRGLSALPRSRSQRPPAATPFAITSVGVGLDQLQHERVDAVGLFKAVDGRDVRWFRRMRAFWALRSARQLIGVTGEGVRDQRDCQLRVAYR